MQRLKNKVAIITGAASGIGNSVAKIFVEEGASVVVADYNEEGAKTAAEQLRRVGTDGHAEAYKVDVSNEQSVTDLVVNAMATFGSIDILVNAAGILLMGNILETSLDDWQRSLAVNLTGTFLCTKTVLPSMLKNKSGSIINFSSSTGAYHATKNAAGYIASKGGVAALTRAVAVDFAEHNIRVNAVCPGPTNTRMLDNVSREQLRQLEARIPLGRVGERDEIAKTVLFLASSEASFITGATIAVDGGQTVNI